jgi:hypothetical protein
MTTTALITMIAAWSVIAYFTIRFFIKVLRIPQEKDK